MTRLAAIYARISSDDGTALGVTRQLDDDKALAHRLGWAIGRIYVDNDVSAFSGKPRRQYAWMLAELESGDRDAVIVYNLDRLHHGARPSWRSSSGSARGSGCRRSQR